jgi:hypothetical protein
MGPIRNPRWEQKRTDGYVIVSTPGVIHTGRFFVLIPLKWLEKLTGVKDKYIPW